MTASGYNEDGVSSNMIEEAMKRINASIGTNLSLFEEGGKEWKDAQSVLEEVAGAWRLMDGAQRSYLTTMMSGVRQQDRFVNLMDAMSDTTDGLTRYQELLGVAMTSNGSTAEKY